MAISLSFSLGAGAVAITGARVVVSVLLVVAGIGKLASMREFKGILANYNLLPRIAIAPVAYSLPIAELLTGVAFLFRSFSFTAQYAAIALFSVFIVAIATNLLRGRREIPCGCLSGRSQGLSWLLVMRNLALIGLVLMGIGKLLPALLLIGAYGSAWIIASVKRRLRSGEARQREVLLKTSTNAS